MASYLERYMDGDTVAVWAEIGAGSVPVRGLDDDIASVVAETMRRARGNCETIARRLPQSGYRFGCYDPRTPVPEWGGPIKPYVMAANLTCAVGSAPASLVAFLETVGTVNFVGYHPDWPPAISDPLVVEPLPTDSLRREYDHWMDYRMQEGHAEPFHLAISPNGARKANLGDGPAYGFELPCETVDAALWNEPGSDAFVAYLRRAFQWGGFPGFARAPEGERPMEHIAYLVHRLLPI